MRWLLAIRKAAFRERRRLLDWLRPPILVVLVPERPTKLCRNILYVTQQANGPAFGFLRCPCGCKQTLHLRFFGDRRPRWELQTLSGKATVHPSVWRQTGCKSHFVLRDGKVNWC